MRDRASKFLDGQWSEFHGTDGTAWRIRIEHGGGRRSVLPYAPRVAALVRRALDSDRGIEFPIAGDVGKWGLAAYTRQRRRALLAEAQAQATEPAAE